MDVLIALLTLVVALATCWIAILTYRSQKEAGTLQRETRDSQLRAEKFLERATEIQNRMDERDLEYRKSRAQAALTFVIRISAAIESRASLATAGTATDMQIMLSAVFGWQEELAFLPECHLKNIAYEVLSRLHAPNPNVDAIGWFKKHVRPCIYNLRESILDKDKIEECAKAIQALK